jgi:hypothetical protein
MTKEEEDEEDEEEEEKKNIHLPNDFLHTRT